MKPNMVCRCQIEKEACTFPGMIFWADNHYWVEDGYGLDYEWRDVKISVDAETYEELTPRLKKKVKVRG